MKSLSSTLLAVLSASTALAVTPSFCPDNGDVCFRWGVPEAVANSRSGNFYLQIKAPTSAQWAGLGTGTQMAGSQMFIVYQDGNGNVTLSPRTVKGEVMPTYAQRKGLELLDGSGVKDNQMIANIRCDNCVDVDLKGTNPWIAAWKEGSSLDSKSLEERISEHDKHVDFDVDFNKATMTSDSNPFTSASEDSSSNSGSNSGSGAVTQTGSSGSPTVILAHGIIMSIVFLAGYPLGAILMPILGKWIIHAGWQTLTLLLMWAGFGLGYVYAKDSGEWGNQAHTRLGTAICALITLQPILGYMHHRYFLSHGKRGVISHVHIWFGRALIIIGIINGGLGLKLASSSKAFIIAYSVIAGIAAVLYLGAAFVGEKRRNASRVKQMSPQMSQEEAR
ncbi:cellobiose dehydrogenase [Fusarium heterosporum]|uniref:Cellobiose dehydrogenase n=1 Tax=Fusarium heterosporum TaxID=42747 RepID=A0A8H5TGU0_FUSHE|nr:cellobiose dehydrogenase [Fusarium heterosporum]